MAHDSKRINDLTLAHVMAQVEHPIRDKALKEAEIASDKARQDYLAEQVQAHESAKPTKTSSKQEVSEITPEGERKELFKKIHEVQVAIEHLQRKFYLHDWAKIQRVWAQVPDVKKQNERIEEIKKEIKELPLAFFSQKPKNQKRLKALKDELAVLQKETETPNQQNREHGTQIDGLIKKIGSVVQWKEITPDIETSDPNTWNAELHQKFAEKKELFAEIERVTQQQLAQINVEALVSEFGDKISHKEENTPNYRAQIAFVSKRILDDPEAVGGYTNVKVIAKSGEDREIIGEPGSYHQRCIVNNKLISRKKFEEIRGIMLSFHSTQARIGGFRTQPNPENVSWIDLFRYVGATGVGDYTFKVNLQTRMWSTDNDMRRGGKGGFVLQTSADVGAIIHTILAQNASSAIDIIDTLCHLKDLSNYADRNLIELDKKIYLQTRSTPYEFGF